MLAYSDVSAYVTGALTALGYGSLGTVDGPEMPLLDPGPPTLAKAQKMSPHSMVILTVGNGIGPTVEALYDQVFVVARVLGPQNDYDSAEQLARDLDRTFLAFPGSAPAMMGATHVLYVTRNAPPQLVDQDANDRYHFQTTYIAEAQR